MRKLFLIAAVLLTVGAAAQVKNNAQINMASGNTYTYYLGTTADTLTENQDSILIPVFVNMNNNYKVIVEGEFLRGGAASDTIVKMAIWGKYFANESWTYITSVNSSAVTSATTPTVKTIDYSTSSLRYRYLRVHFKRPVPVAAGATKIKLSLFQIKTVIQ